MLSVSQSEMELTVLSLTRTMYRNHEENVAILTLEGSAMCLLLLRSYGATYLSALVVEDHVYPGLTVLQQ